MSVPCQSVAGGHGTYPIEHTACRRCVTDELTSDGARHDGCRQMWRDVRGRRTKSQWSEAIRNPLCDVVRKVRCGGGRVMSLSLSYWGFKSIVTNLSGFKVGGCQLALLQGIRNLICAAGA